MSRHVFRDRREAGAQLGSELRKHHLDQPVVLGLPRGGVPVAALVAEAIGAPLDVIVVRKLGVPYQPEYAMGAIATGDVRVLNTQVIQQLKLSYADIDIVTRAELRELHPPERRDGQGVIYIYIYIYCFVLGLSSRCFFFFGLSAR